MSCSSCRVYSNLASNLIGNPLGGWPPSQDSSDHQDGIFQQKVFQLSTSQHAKPTASPRGWITTGHGFFVLCPTRRRTTKTRGNWFNLCGRKGENGLTQPMAKLSNFWGFLIFSRENKVQTYFSGFIG